MTVLRPRPDSPAPPPASHPDGAPRSGLPALEVRRAVVVDAGIGNLGNLVRALRHLDAAAEVTSDPRAVAASRCLLLPGVGAFAPPREVLRGALEEALRAALRGGAWLLGICVGFQLLFEAGEEFGETDGLGLLPGRVTRLPPGVPVPHIGWNRLHDLAGHPLLAGLAAAGPARAAGPGAGVERRRPAQSAAARQGASGVSGLGRYVYFVHSYAPEGVPEECCLAWATHGRAFAAVAGRGRVLGTQFHPERSGETGLRLLENFLEMAHGAAAGA
jgi:imidazole glycerol-phosphate synthase subunit HisH